VDGVISGAGAGFGGGTGSASGIGTGRTGGGMIMGGTGFGGGAVVQAASDTATAPSQTSKLGPVGNKRNELWLLMIETGCARLFALFIVSEKVNARRAKVGAKKGLEEFNLDHQPQVDVAHLKARPGCVLVALRDYNNMEHLKRVLEKTNLRRHDVVVMTVKAVNLLLTRPAA